MESFSCDRERGQVLALCSVFLVVLLGFAAMAVDVGSWYVEKHKLQSAADAAALAGAGHLPAGFAVAQATASAQFNKNKTSGDAAAITNVTTNTANDTVQVIATGTAPSFFAKVFGHDQTNLRVTAKAVIRTVTSFSSTGNVMPFGVMKGSYTPGTSYTIYGDGSSSNNGALSLDIISGSNCATVNGSNEVRDTIIGADIACPITVGDTAAVKTGNNTGPIAQGLNSRMSGGWQTFNQIVSSVGNGLYEVKDWTSKQLVVIPIVTNLQNGTTWPQGSNDEIRVVGFAYFVITGCGNPTKPGPCTNSDGKYVNGTFVDLVDASTVPDTGAWDPNAGSITHIQLSE